MKRAAAWATILLSATVLACSSNVSNGNTGGAGGSGAANTGGGANTGGSGTGGSGGSGAAPTFGPSTCMGMLECVVNCPNNDQACTDNCLAQGSQAEQNKLISLANCVSNNNCPDVACIQTKCTAELTTCVDSTATGSGQPNPGGTVPTGSVPPQLVGQWTTVGSTEWASFTFNADGSATHHSYKESTLSCTIVVDAKWDTGSATVSGDTLTVNLGAGLTTVAYKPADCGTAYSKPSQPTTYTYKWKLDTSTSPPYLELTDSPCNMPAIYCTDRYKKQ